MGEVIIKLGAAVRYLGDEYAPQCGVVKDWKWSIGGSMWLVETPDGSRTWVHESNIRRTMEHA